MSTKNLLICCVFALTACSGGPSSMSIPDGNYVPDVNLKGEGLKKYYDDVAECQKQILKQYGDKYITNNAITDLRRCLIDKGYVLLS